MNNISSRRSRAQLDAEMPLRQYFLFVGGALLALLFVANWLVPASRERADSAVNFPPIRIHSDRKGPEAVVIDTKNKSMLAPMLAVHEDVVATQAVSSEEAAIDNASAPSETRMSQQTEASELTQTREDRTSRQVAEARKERRTVFPRSHQSLHEPVSTTHVDSAAAFRGTFAQLGPGSLKQGGRGEPKMRAHVTLFNW